MLELTVTVVDLQKVEARTSLGVERSGRVEHDPLRANTIRILDNWLRKSPIVSRDELEVLGEHLFDTLFQGDVRELLSQCLNEADQGTPLRLQLSFKHEAQALASYPWEYLYRRDGERGHFLSTHARLVLSRFMPPDKKRQTLAAKDPDLRILLAVAEPEDAALGPVVAGPVTEAVERVADELTAGKMSIGDGSARLMCSTKVEKLESTTLDGLLDAIDRFKPHVVHLIGHGRYDRAKGMGEIALLADESKRVRWVQDTLLKEQFLNLSSCPRLVFLHMCQGGAVDFERNFAGVAPQLIGAGVQAVVAMQHPITNAAAILFANAFYKQVGLGQPIDLAVQLGRAKVSSSESVHAFGTPVLYMQSSDGVIVREAEPKPPDAESGAAGRPSEQPRSTVGTAAPTGQSAQTQPIAPATAGNAPQSVLPMPEPSTNTSAERATLRLKTATSEGTPEQKEAQKAGRFAARKLGLMKPELIARIDRVTKVPLDIARAELSELVGGEEADPQVVPIWSAMLDALESGSQDK